MNLLLMLVSLIVFRIPGRVCQTDYEICRQPFQCGDQTDIPYPFYGGDRPASCGFPGFDVSCQEGVPLINITRIIYRIRDINNQTRTLTVARNDLWNDICSPQLLNISVDTPLYSLSSAANDQEITLVYGCSGQTQLPQPNLFSCDGNGEINGLAYFTTIALPQLPSNSSITCNGPEITVRLNQTGVALLTANPSSLQTSLQTGFSIQWSEDKQNCESCLGSGGACGSNPSGSFACHCANGTFESTCSNAPTQNDSPDKKQNRRTIIVTTVVLGSILVAVCAYFLLKLLFKYRARKHRSRLLFFNTKEIDTGYSEERAFKHDKHAVQLEELPIFTFMMLSNATDNFDRANKLGQGGFGSVYKGRLQNGVEIAVKRLARSSNQGVDEFMNEVEVISRLQHRNLVRLLGCCVEIEEKLLVYEYMPNGSLDAYLFGSLKHDFLDWQRRKLIIEGICRGLLYLHRDSRLKIIHRDLKPSNILLDEELNPKISDFGMARIFGGKDDEANTTRVVGTFGYMSPEYAHRGIFSEKSDVYSLGVLLIEIVSGKKNSSFYDEDQQLFLTACAWKLWNEGRIVKLIDPAIYDGRMEDDILRYANVGLLCVQEMAADRPNASTVLSMLSREIVELPHPKQPAFLGMQSFQSIESSSNKCSVNGVTFSTVDQGR